MADKNESEKQFERRREESDPPFSPTENQENSLQKLSWDVELDELNRQKLARTLHDGLSQTVSALAMRINFTRRMMNSDPDAAQRELEKVEALTRKTAREIRYMIFILHPPSVETDGLDGAIESLAEKLDDLFDLEIELQVNRESLKRLPHNTQRVVFYIISEALDYSRVRNNAHLARVRLDAVAEGMMQVEVESLGVQATEEGILLQSPEVDSIRRFTGLLQGSVHVEEAGLLVKAQFPIG